MFTPSMDSDRRSELRTGWSKALDRARAWETPDPSDDTDEGEATPEGSSVKAS
jgi:glycerol kinase